MTAVTFLRQSLSEVSGANINLFTYCFLVEVKIRNKDEKVISYFTACLIVVKSMMSFQISCLNVLQKLRGSLIPGYVSLFERSDENSSGRSERDGRSRRKSIESLERLLEGVEALSVGVNTEK